MLIDVDNTSRIKKIFSITEITNSVRKIKFPAIRYIQINSVEGKGANKIILRCISSCAPLNLIM